MFLKDILRIASGLHHHDGGDDNDDASGGATTPPSSSQSSSLSLKQLVPVHKSLLETIDITSTYSITPDGGAMDVDESLGEWWFIEFVTNPAGVVENDNNKADESSLDHCRGIIYGVFDDRTKLLAWQYLLYQARYVNKIDPMVWLSEILLKLLSNPNINNMSNELADVLLDLSLEWIFSTEQQHLSWEQFRTKSKNQSISSASISTKVVMKIVLFYSNKPQQYHHDDQLLSLFISMYYEHLWCNIEFAASATATTASD